MSQVGDAQRPKLNAHHEPRVAGEGTKPPGTQVGCVCVPVLVGGWQGGPEGFHWDMDGGFEGQGGW